MANARPTAPSARRGFTLIEAMVAVAITSVTFIATVSLLLFGQMNNELEQERARAHQIVSQHLEIERFQLFTWTQSGQQVTIWDNNTPEDTSDDTQGTLYIIVKDAATGATLTLAPNPAVLVEVEVVLEWAPNVRPSRTLRESAMTYKAPS